MRSIFHLPSLIRRILQAFPQRWVFEGMYSLCGDPWHYGGSRDEGVRLDDLLDCMREVRTADEWRTSRILEVGCSVGVSTRRLLDLDPRGIVALDISARALDRARRRVHSPKVEFARLDVFSEAPPGKFDFVVASDVLYYTEDPDVLAATRDRLLDSLTSGGLALISHTRLRAHDGGGFESFPSGYPLIGATPIARCFAERCETVVTRIRDTWQTDVFRPK